MANRPGNQQNRAKLVCALARPTGNFGARRKNCQSAAPCWAGELITLVHVFLQFVTRYKFAVPEKAHMISSLFLRNEKCQLRDRIWPNRYASAAWFRGSVRNSLPGLEERR